MANLPIVNGMLMDFLRSYKSKNKKTTRFFTDVCIETITTCNRRCSYCPNSIFDRGLRVNEKLMKESLFKKIIDELDKINFDGRMSPMWYGEPLLDKRLVGFMDYTRKKLPNVSILTITNGDFLTIKLYNKLIEAGVGAFAITQHGKNMPKNIILLFEYLKKNPEKEVDIIYQKFTDKTPLFNRGGLIKPKTIDYKPRCLYPRNPLIVNYRGDVVICTNDYHSSVVFGNIEKESLVDIWNNKKWKLIRDELKGGVFRLDICKKCVGII